MATLLKNTPELTEVLKRMWEINTKLANKETLTEEERVFYNSNLDIIQDYYITRSNYWLIQRHIKYGTDSPSKVQGTASVVE